MSKMIKSRLAGKVDSARKNETDINISKLKEQVAKLEASVATLSKRKPKCDPHMIQLSGDHAYRLWLLEN